MSDNNDNKATINGLVKLLEVSNDKLLKYSNELQHLKNLLVNNIKTDNEGIEDFIDDIFEQIRIRASDNCDEEVQLNYVINFIKYFKTNPTAVNIINTYLYDEDIETQRFYPDVGCITTCDKCHKLIKPFNTSCDEICLVIHHLLEHPETKKDALLDMLN